MAAAAATAGADRIFLMGYDYHWAGSEPGASAPIDRLDGEAARPRLVARPLRGARRAGRADAARPAAVRDDLAGHRPGRRRAADRTRRRLGPAPEPAVFADPSFEPTLRADRERRVLRGPDPGATAGVAGRSGSPLEPARRRWASPACAPEPGWNAVYYDSPRSLTPKLALADERGLAGAGFWAIGYERGLPGYTELIATFRAGRARQAP